MADTLTVDDDEWDADDCRNMKRTADFMTIEKRKADKRIADLEAALRRINSLIDSPARFNADVQAVLDSVIDTSDKKFEKT